MITTNFNPALAQFRPSAFGRLQRHIGVANHTDETKATGGPVGDKILEDLLVVIFRDALTKYHETGVLDISEIVKQTGAWKVQLVPRIDESDNGIIYIR